MFEKRKSKNRRSNTLKVHKPEKRSRLDKVIDILSAAAEKDSRPKPKRAVKRKEKTNTSDWNATISW